jgi:AcrR family transcriptional regulator
MTRQEPPQPSDPEDPGAKRGLATGRHFLSREAVYENQRERLIAGVATATAERGYAELTVADVIGLAGVSRRTFYEHFADKGEAIRIAHEVILERFLESLTRACDSEDEWAPKVKTAIGTTIECAIADPSAARLLTLDAVASGTEATRFVLDSSDRLADLLRPGRRYASHGLPELTEKALVGAISAVVGGRLRVGEPESLRALEPQLVELTLIPYLGAERAARVATESD